MTTFLNGLVSGISFGSILALIALGFVIIYRSTHTLSFCHGQLLTLGGYVAYMFTGAVRGAQSYNPWSIARLPLWLATIISMLVLGVIGFLIELLVVRRFRSQPIFAAIMATLGVGILIGAVTSARWGTVSVAVPSPFEPTDIVRLGSIRIAYVDLFTIALVVALGLAFFLGFQRSKLGTAMKATASDPEAAIAQGINPNVIFGMSWAIASALAALSGVLLSIGAGSLFTQLGPSISAVAFFGFPAIVLGGVDSLEGAVLGGLIIGIVYNLFATYEESVSHVAGHEFFKLAPFIVMIVVLVVRPAGLFGTKEVRRV